LICLLGFVFTTEPCGEKPPQQPWGTYITAGRETEPGAWPWQVSLQYFNDDRYWYHSCGGVLIEADWVLTAAHCFMRSEDVNRYRVVVGAHNIKSLTGSEQIIVADLIVEHKHFYPFPPFGYPNDIALLRLSTPVDLTKEGVGLACIPDESLGDFAENPDCWISGWGLTYFLNEDIPEVLQEANVPALSNRQCWRYYKFILRDEHICAGTGTPNACRGDSGGPMSCKIGDIWYVAGVTSFGPAFCSRWPAVYTRLTSYYNWIYDNMAANQRSYAP